MRGMAEGEAIVAYREGICVCPEDLVTSNYSRIKCNKASRKTSQRRTMSWKVYLLRAPAKGIHDLGQHVFFPLIDDRSVWLACTLSSFSQGEDLQEELIPKAELPLLWLTML
eukprot:178634-Pelagomonas_calceolata.AAC.1